MQTGYVMLFLIIPTVLVGCCVGNHKIRGLQQNITHQHYRVVKGEIFMMPCKMCSKIEEEGNKGVSYDCGSQYLTEAKHSGNYTCHPGGSKFHLQVLEKTSLQCPEPEDSSIMLVASKGGKIPCPGLNCYSTDVSWYKGNNTLCRSRPCSMKNGELIFAKVSYHDTGVYFCDRLITEQGVTWTFRRAVNVTSIPRENATYSPRIAHPADNMTEVVQLGQPHNLTCEVYFPFEIKFLPEVQWYVNYSGSMENMTLLHMQSQQQNRVSFEEYVVIQTAIINEVTPLHLNHRYTCIARNTVNTTSATVKLKTEVKWPSLVGYPIASLLLVAGLGIILRVKWLEVQVIYKSHFQRGKLDGDEKEFDVFLSYVLSPPSAEVEGGLTLSSPSRPDSDVKECLSSLDPLNTEEGNTQRALEVLLPQVLEDRWGYRLCLLERDVLPGGAYTNDVVHAIQRSKMLICLLSDDYLSNSNAVFVLESGVQALLHNSALKLLLIWTNRTSKSLVQPDPPLPSVVQRALKVLPSLDWTSGKPASATSNFWRSLKKAMPNHRVKLVSLMQNQ
ncbi:interleukin-18 receptor accessory protein-like isoform X1 [Thunnus albacares]|uniref:interleukin-18 receptor accessory protein-like isoform X1 n=2 Tax=Thunnus albacares TaxID=8236 RepID=UPI001CF6F418|nr:interleukin-18 receptor accessory protein-like isoform X1 [Thunnus albacares]